MTSKISYSKFIKEDIRHRGWLAALSCVLLLLSVTINILLQLEASLSSDVLDRDAQIKLIRNLYPGMLNGSCNIFLFLLIILLGVLAAVTGFSYLHSKEKVDFYHSLPLSRQQLFFISWIGGLLTFLVPYLAACLLTLLAGSAYGIMTASVLGKSCMAILGAVLGFLMVYHLTIFAMMLTGKIVTGILAAATMSVYGTMVNSLGDGLMSHFFSTYTAENPGIFDKLHGFLSPLITLGRLLGSTGSSELNNANSYTYFFQRIFHSAGTESIPGILAVTVLFLAVVLFLSVLLYKNRPSEAAGNALAYPITAPFIKIVIAVPTSLFLGLLVGSIYYESAKWMILLSILSVILLCALIEFIYHMDLHRLFAGKYSSLISLLGVAGILCILQFDLFGYDTWLPKDSSLESMALDISPIYNYFSYSYYIPYNADHSPYPDLLNGSECQLTDFTPIYELAREGVENHQNGLEPEDGVNITVRYNKKSGRPSYRRYVVSKEHALEALAALCQEERYLEKLFPIFSVDYENVSAVHLTDIYYEPVELELSPAEQEALLDAYKQDVRNADIRDLQYEDPIGELSLDLLDDGQQDVPAYGRYGNNYITVPDFYLYENYENSLALLEKYGYTIRREIDPEDVAQITWNDLDYKDSVDAYGNTIWSEESEESVITDPKEIREILSQILYCTARILGNEQMYPHSVDIVFQDNPDPIYYILQE